MTRPSRDDTALITARFNAIPPWQKAIAFVVGVLLTGLATWTTLFREHAHDHDLIALGADTFKSAMLLAVGLYLIALAWFGPRTANKVWTAGPIGAVMKFFRRTS